MLPRQQCANNFAVIEAKPNKRHASRYIGIMPRPTFLASLIRSEPVRVAQMIAGLLLMIAAPPLALIPQPFPAALIIFGIGLALVLRNSGWARRRYVRWHRRFPRAGRVADFGLQRRGHRDVRALWRDAPKG